MTRLQWNQPGERGFSTGINKGVLYPRGSGGVVWEGLTAIKEQRSAGKPKAFYQDGVKFLNEPPPRNFRAAIEAFGCPPEFTGLTGLTTDGRGLFFDNQPATTFGLSYQTRLGNDIDGVDKGYLVHFIFNATASAASKPYQTLSDAPEPMKYSWELETFPGEYPYSHVAFPQPVSGDHWSYHARFYEMEGYAYGSVGPSARLPKNYEIQRLLEAKAAV